ncbi:hypothetical protein [Streptacidiphilus jiangxiensis]|uniref:Uncharacterized protein n=1 Tax=Streptacidiphilus jiangxiensis TaxID=235985 RepID=A0A1H8B5B7_STRJI|nr:hypothetical protein [Streptacidiphilus jiangxiensis]SEM77943.1 hypothetical protein SAMN05414137_15718 [Streptacidiphilus jiangxiensis]
MTDPSLQPAAVSGALVLAGFPSHAPHRSLGFRVEIPGPLHPEATTRLRWHGDDPTPALDAVRTYLVWSGRAARPGRDRHGPYVMVLDARCAAAGDMVLPRPKITPNAAGYTLVSADRPQATGLSAQVVTDLATDARRRGLAVYQLPSGEIRMGVTSLIPEPSHEPTA